MNNILYLDIETIPDQTPGALEAIRASIEPPGNISKPETIAKWMEENAVAKSEEAWRKTALDGSKGEVVVAGWAFNDFVPRRVIRDSLRPGDEKRLLFDTFESILMELETLPDAPLTIVGHCVKDFDLRFLFQRAVIAGVRPTFDLGVGQRYPAHIYDTMTEWAGWGNRISLANLCKALNVPVKQGGIDGSMVWDLVKSNRIVEVADYCCTDVVAVRECHRRMTFAG